MSEVPFEIDGVTLRLPDRQSHSLPRVKWQPEVEGEDGSVSSHRHPYGLLYNPFKCPVPHVLSMQHFSPISSQAESEPSVFAEHVDSLLKEGRGEEAIYFVLCFGHHQAYEHALAENVTHDVRGQRVYLPKPKLGILDEQLYPPDKYSEIGWTTNDGVEIKFEHGKVIALMHALYRFYSEITAIRGMSLKLLELHTKMWNACFGDDIVDALQLGSTHLRNRNVLILGEPGTGKQLVARCIQAGTMGGIIVGERGTDFVKDPPKMACSAAEVYAPSFQGELFGIARNAFTDVVGRAGKIELADKGSLFIDEIAELPLEVQAGLLRVVQEGKVTRAGGSEVRDVNVRYIVATNADIETRVSEGEFRRDLLIRFSSIVLNVPPLSERVYDIVRIAQNIMEGILASVIDPTTKQQIHTRFHRWREEFDAGKHRDWPDNVRGLQHAIWQVLFTREDGYSFKIEKVPNELDIDTDEWPNELDVDMNELQSALDLDVNAFINTLLDPSNRNRDYDDVLKQFCKENVALDIASLVRNKKPDNKAPQTPSDDIPEKLRSREMTLEELKLWYARDVLNRVIAEGGTKVTAANRLGISDRTLDNWLPDTVRSRSGVSSSTDSTPGKSTRGSRKKKAE